MIGSLRTTGWEGPLGWPDINPTEMNNFNVEDYIYTRTTNEAKAVSMDCDVELKDIALGDGAIETDKEILQMLQVRYQLDALWEKLTESVTLFAITYEENGKVNLETDSDYQSAMSDYLQIRAYISVMTNLYDQLDQDPSLQSALEKTARNSVSIEDAMRDGQVKPEYASVYDSWKAVNDDATEVPNDPTAAAADALGTWLSNAVANLLNVGHIEDKYNRMTVSQSNAFFSKYTTWADSIKTQLAAFKDKTGIDGELYTYSATYPKSVILKSRQENMDKFKQDVELIDSLCMDVNARSIWVFLQIGNIKFSTLKYEADGTPNSNYIVNFDYKKNGSGLANSFTFDLAYNPPPGDTDINKLEKVISKRQVFFQFGYNELDTVCSPQYSGQILSYTTSIENNYIKFSITGYSEAAEARFGKVDIPDYSVQLGDTMTDEEKAAVIDNLGIQATEYAKQILEIYLAGYGYDVVIDKSAKNADRRTVITGSNTLGLFQAVDKILSQAVLTDEIAAQINSNAEKSSENNDQSVSETSDTEEAQVDAENTQSYFTYTIDDSSNENGNKTVTIIRVLSKTELEHSDIVPSVAFSWGGDFNGVEKTVYSAGSNFTSYYDEQQEMLDEFYSEQAQSSLYSKGQMKMLSNVVQSFSTSYQGEVTLSRAYQEASNNVRFDKNGNLVQIYTKGLKNATGDTAITDERYSYWLWERNTMFSYNATLNLVGIPSDIPIGTYLYIKPMVNGVEHHTAGFYYVTGSEDKMTSSGYTTTINLVRIVDKTTDDTLKALDKKRKGLTYRTKEIADGLSAKSARSEQILLKKWLKEQKNK